jgi:excinuclease UvrABC nuclease subunit
MTPRERAGLFIDQHCATMDYDRRKKAFYVVWNLLDEVIKFAIEEDRKSRECCKQEWEACVGIVKKEIERWDRESVVELRGSILHEIEIRARSES